MVERPDTLWVLQRRDAAAVLRSENLAEKGEVVRDVNRRVEVRDLVRQFLLHVATHEERATLRDVL